ncbi:tetratricopeptide repeat protein [Pandoraea sp. NPDC090278]|uniref:tetratricopeptide repeat protein n=1 Tax=Pandoraea sp. NPDC090278 TaxID=3364391 RepID=UPI003839DD5D
MRTLRILAILSLSSFSVYFPISAKSQSNFFSGSFEETGSFGKFTFQSTPNNSGLMIEYRSQSLKEPLSYYVEKFDECSSMSIFPIHGTQQVAIDGSCISRGGQIYRYVYQWIPERENWCLTREITGERPEKLDSPPLRWQKVARVKPCFPPGERGPYTYESPKIVRAAIATELRRFRSAISTPKTLEMYLSSLLDYQISEMISNITEENVRDINDLGYFLIRGGRSSDARAILEQIIEKFPERTVAKLNLADAYWSMEMFSHAEIFYAQYVSDMKARKLERKIPERAITRSMPTHHQPLNNITH